MPASCYILPADQQYYGVGQLLQSDLENASGLLNAYLNRPVGMMWMPDASGFPCYMAAAMPLCTFQVPGPITAGSNVVIPLPGRFPASDALMGEIVVLDRLAGNGTVECAAINQYTPNSITLNTVSFNHAGPVTLDFGMALSENRHLPDDRPICRVSQPPVAVLLSGTGRYGYTRRSEGYTYYQDEVSLLTIQAAFGGPPAWEFFSTTNTSVSAETGEIWIPTGQLLANFTEVRLRYLAGWSYATIPHPIKQATAAMAKAMINGQLPGNVTRLKAGNIEIDRAVTSSLDTDMLRQVRSYRAVALI